MRQSWCFIEHVDYIEWGTSSTRTRQYFMYRMITFIIVSKSIQFHFKFFNVYQLFAEDYINELYCRWGGEVWKVLLMKVESTDLSLDCSLGLSENCNFVQNPYPCSHINMAFYPLYFFLFISR